MKQRRRVWDRLLLGKSVCNLLLPERFCQALFLPSPYCLQLADGVCLFVHRLSAPCVVILLESSLVGIILLCAMILLLISSHFQIFAALLCTN